MKFSLFVIIISSLLTLNCAETEYNKRGSQVGAVDSGNVIGDPVDDGDGQTGGDATVGETAGEASGNETGGETSGGEGSGGETSGGETTGGETSGGETTGGETTGGNSTGGSTGEDPMDYSVTFLSSELQPSRSRKDIGSSTVSHEQPVTITGGYDTETIQIRQASSKHYIAYKRQTFTREAYSIISQPPVSTTLTINPVDPIVIEVPEIVVELNSIPFSEAFDVSPIEVQLKDSNGAFTTIISSSEWVYRETDAAHGNKPTVTVKSPRAWLRTPGELRVRYPVKNSNYIKEFALTGNPVQSSISAYINLNSINSNPNYSYNKDSNSIIFENYPPLNSLVVINYKDKNQPTKNLSYDIEILEGAITPIRNNIRAINEAGDALDVSYENGKLVFNNESEITKGETVTVTYLVEGKAGEYRIPDDAILSSVEVIFKDADNKNVSCEGFSFEIKDLNAELSCIPENAVEVVIKYNIEANIKNEYVFEDLTAEQADALTWKVTVNGEVSSDYERAGNKFTFSSLPPAAEVKISSVQ